MDQDIYILTAKHGMLEYPYSYGPFKTYHEAKLEKDKALKGLYVDLIINRVQPLESLGRDLDNYKNSQQKAE